MTGNNSAHDAADDTRPTDGGDSVSAPARERGGRRGRRRPVAVVVAILALVIVAALGTWAVLNAGSSQPTAAPVGTSTLTQSTAAPDAQAASTHVEDPAESVSLLYSLSATAGTLTRLAGSADEYTLVLSDTDKQVLWFADQPSRKAGVMPTGGFASEWAGFGFATDPPNVAVVLHDAGPDADTVIAEMQAPTFDSGSGTFTAVVRILEDTERDGVSGKLSQHATNADAALPGTFDGVSLFIDDVAGTVVNGCLIQPYTVCEGADLAGAKLSGMNLTGADLTGADLSGADLSGANLSGANFTGANLTGANLLGATLTGTIFTGATMTGAQLSAAPPTAPSINYPFCSGASTGSLVLADGVVATSFSAPNNGGRGTVTLVGPDGLSLDATFVCTNRTASANTAARSGSWTLTVTGNHGSFGSPVTGLTVQNGSATGTIVRHNSVLTWSVAAVATLAINGVTATGQLAITGPHDWSVDLIGAGGQFTDPDSGTLRASSASGTITDASGAVSGTVHLGLAGNHKFVQALPAGWTKSAVVDLSFARKAGSSVPMTRSVTLSVGATSGVDSLSLSGPWTPDGYSLTGTGTLQLNGTTVAVTGSYGSTGSQDSSGTTLTSAQWNLEGQFSGVPLGGGATITSGSISVSSETPGIVGSATVQPQAGNAFRLLAGLDYSGPAAWTLTFSGSGSATPWSPPGLSGIDITAGQVSGTITSSPGSRLAWGLSVADVSGTLATGITLSTTLSISNSCPLAPVSTCGTATGIFFGFTNGQLSLPAPAPTVTAQGAILVDGTWGLIQAKAGTVSFTGPAGTPITLSGTSLTMWKGPSVPETVPGLGMPDLSAQNNGFGVEFCGDFNANLPYIGSSVSTGGCVEWTPAGIVIAQVGLTGSTPGGTATAGTAGSSVSGITVGGTTFTGWAWTNLNSTPHASLNGVPITLAKGSSTLTGTMQLPGALLTAIGKPGVDPVAPAIATFSDQSFVAADASFTLDARLAVGTSGQGFALDAITIHLSRTPTSTSISLGVDASYSVDGATFPVVLSVAAANGSGLTISLTATGARTTARACNPACDGVIVPLRTPSSGYKYLSDAFGGIPGAHLWSVTGQLEVVKGEPGFGVGATVYFNPKSIPNLFHGSTWMKGDFYVNVSDLNPCFNFDFASTDPNTYLQIKGGVLETSTFRLAIAPRGCSIGAESLPVGSTFIFHTSLGNDSSIDIDLAIGRDANGLPTFTSDTTVSELVLGGIDFVDMELAISITAAAQSVRFTGDMTLSVGQMNSSLDLTVAAEGGIHMDGDVTLADWSLSGGSSGFDVSAFNFHMSMDTSSTSCGSFSAGTSGTMSMGKKTNLSFSGTIAENCGVLQELTIDFAYSHKNISYDFDLAYSASTGILAGGLDFSFSHTSSHRFTSGGYNYERGSTVAIYLDFSLDTKNPGAATLDLGGSLSGGSISGSVACEFSSGDDSCSASIHVEIHGVGSFGDSATW